MLVFQSIRTALLCLSLVLLGAKLVRGDADFYVAVDGSDDWSGRLAEPKADRSDGPFASLERARNAVRVSSAEKPSEDVVVRIRGGVYSISQTIVFGLEDSRQGEATTTYEAFPGENPTFSSRKKVEGFRRVSGTLPGLPEQAQGKVWVADMPDRFFALFDSKGLMPRARSEGFIPLKGGTKERLHFPKGALKNWSNLDDVELVIRPQHAWVLNILPLKSVDEKRGIAQTSIIASYLMKPLHFLPDLKSCWVENVLEALDEPGEWVLNTQERKLYVWPRGQSQIYYPQLKEFIRVEDEVEVKGPVDVPVRNLQFRGLSFMHGDRYSILKDDKGLQHDWDLYDKANAMLRFRGAENCLVEDCTFTESGGGAIRFDLHAKKNRVLGNRIDKIGSTGILFAGYGPGTKDVNVKNLISNNHIQETGLIYKHSPGIMLWQSGENRVSNNLIHHNPYTGIIICGVITDFFHRWKREMSPTIRWHEVKGERQKRTIDEVALICTHTITRLNIMRFTTSCRSSMMGMPFTSEELVRTMSYVEITFTIC